MIASSFDFIKWTKPAVLVDTIKGKYSELVITACGFHQYKEMLNVYFCSYEYVPENIRNEECIKTGTGHMDTELYAISTKDKVSWSKKKSMHLKVCPNQGPQKTHSGRLIISGNLSYPYGMSSWKMSGIYPSGHENTLANDSASFKTYQELASWPTLYARVHFNRLMTAFCICC